MTNTVKIIRQITLNTLRRLVLTVLLIAVLTTPAPAAEKTLTQGDIRVHYQEGYDDLAKSAASKVRLGTARVGKVLGFELTGRIDVYLTRDRAEFDLVMRRLSVGRVSEWAAAVAVPALKTIVIKMDSIRLIGSGGFLETLDHEITHLYLGGVPVPTWLNEGLAEYASGRKYSDAEERLVRRMARGGALIPLDDLAGSFPSDRVRANLAYIQSGMFVRYLYKELGSGRIADVLKWVRNGHSTREAFREVTDRELGELWQKFTREQDEGYSWIRDLLLSIPFYGYIGLGVMLAFAVTMVRRRRKMRRMEEDEEYYGAY